MKTSTILPKDITLDKDSGYEVASFGFYEGKEYAKEQKLEQTWHFSEVFAGTHFIVCCGNVMVRVESTDYPEISRREI